MKKYYLAVDIGASSGRHILGHMENGLIQLEEIYRFPNGMVERNGHKCWDIALLFEEIKTGMKRCNELGKIPCSMAVDTWGVDFVLLDDKDQLLGDAVAYRDERTHGMDMLLSRYLSEEELYARSGIQKQLFNSIYQLMALKSQEPALLSAARSLLFIPDYFHFLLCGEKVSEYSIASTSQLLDPASKDWDYPLLQLLCYPEQIFCPVKKPGTVLGSLRDAIAEEVGFSCDIILPASHDTGSAVMAVPSTRPDSLYISSGTWSLMGVELPEAICTEASRRANLSNEGGYDYRCRFLKNIMGLWMIQSVRHELRDSYSYPQLCTMAEEAKDFPSRVNVNDDCFFAPQSMIQAIRDYCKNSGQPIPETPGQLATVVYQSLADSYKHTVQELESITGRHYDSINIVGGGSNADYLNQLCANATGRTVFAGPSEATAIGNLLAQMLACGEFSSLEQARENVFHSFSVKTFQPE